MGVPAAMAEALGKVLADGGGVELAMLFGSFARGRAREDSDVDVAVGGRDIDLPGLAADLSAAVGREVDVVDLRDAGFPLTQALLRDAVVLYEARPGASASWRTRAILEVETDRPWYERMRDAYLARLAAGRRG